MSFFGLFGKKKKDAGPTWTDVQAQIAQLNQPSPERQALNDRGQAMLAEETTPGFDVTQSQYLGPYLSLYQHAKGTDANLQNLGAATWGTNELQTTNPAAAARINAQMQGAISEEAAANLGDAYRGLHGEALGLLDAGAGESLTRAQAATSATGSGYSSYLNRPRTGFWSTFKQSLGASLGNTLGGGNPQANKAVAGLF